MLLYNYKIPKEWISLMKTLYISDLDGTLLNPNAELTKRTTSIINDLTSQGVLFTVATARSIASVKYILKDLNLTLPIVLMNGVCVYDLTKHEYINVECLSKDNSKTLIDIIERNKLKGFLYTLADGKLATYYEDLSNRALKDFYQERVDKFKKPFTQVENFSECIDEPIIYFTLMDYKENLEELNQIVEKLPNINSVFYKDNYAKNMWYLEIFSENASKYHAVKFLRDYLMLDKIIGFGDNQNDMALFDACDNSYAVGNAIKDLKLKADNVIGTNTEDGVALWLEKNA